MVRKNIFKCDKNTIYHQGVCKVGKTRKRTKEINSNVKRINKLMFNPTKRQTDSELFEVVVLKNKVHHFNFLKGRTRIQAVGDWKSSKGKIYDKEKNVVVQVQFKDTKGEKVGKELIKRFKKLNKDLVGEELLYTRTIPIEETSL